MMTSADRLLLSRTNTALHALVLYMAGEIELTHEQFDAYFEQFTSLLEELNNHKFRLRMSRDT